MSKPVITRMYLMLWLGRRAHRKE